jgi:translation initiation factor eIF-2B subunit alpha/methylthioribose-1-phosphate isomerase
MRINGKEYTSVWAEGEKIKFIDQRKLPDKLEFFSAETVEEVAYAIRRMVVRGAPAIGVAGAFGMAIGSNTLQRSAEILKKTRPTAVDLFNAIDFMMDEIEKGKNPFESANEWYQRVVTSAKKIGMIGAELIKNGTKGMTHCNAGPLATVDWGTALSPFILAHRKGKKFHVWVSETRPRLQGALTSWELLQEGIPHKIFVDSASGFLMKNGEVDLIIVGADRVATNGDVANKIGTYEKAVLAKENGVPFYVAVPSTTIDRNLSTGEKIPIEERDIREVVEIKGRRIVSDKIQAINPAFDITPAKYITGYITEKGIINNSDFSGL